jgi:putative ABC transport system ATP-binding protein
VPYDASGNGIVVATEQGWDTLRIPIRVDEAAKWGTRASGIGKMLELVNVKKSYQQPNGAPLPILSIPHFAVAAGEQVVLVGRSGGGKTTLLHLIAGITRPDVGQIIFEGRNIERLSEAASDRFRATWMGYVFQTFNLLPAFTALENVLLGMTFSRKPVDRQRAITLLERVGLGDRMQHKPTALSVGEQQRVAVARALANKPRLLLADEPTANIDSANQQNIVDLIRETAEEEKISLVLVTHAMEVAEQFKRVVLLDEINELTIKARTGIASWAKRTEE